MSPDEQTSPLYFMGHANSNMTDVKNLVITLLMMTSSIEVAAKDKMRNLIFQNFEKTWKFVNVRYRKDTGEMRFTYANDIAWNYLQKKGKNYPDGAAFGKISVATHADEAFPSSVIPSGKRRVQFMIRDKKGYKATNGWNYGLYKPNGDEFKGDPLVRSHACAACHQIVEDRGHVFSRPMAVFGGNSSVQIETGTSWQKSIKFLAVDRKDLDSKIQKILPKKIKNIRLIKGNLRKYYFSGTLDEIRPVLIEEALRTKNATGLTSLNGREFSIVFPNQNKVCSGKKGFQGITAFHTVPNLKRPVIKLELCEEYDEK
jgi:hypothetical protein